MATTPSLWTRRSILTQAGMGASAVVMPRWTWASVPSLPPSMALNYTINGRLSGVNVTANGALTWQRNASHYAAHLSMTALIVFKREQVSNGTLNALTLQPLHFEDRKRHIQVADFDPQRHQVRYGHGTTLDWPEQGQDRVSMLLALGVLLSQALAAGQRSFSLPVSDGTRWSDWRFDIEGKETVSTPSGAWPVWRVQRSDAGAAGQDTTVWLAPNLHNLPVRLRIHEANGDSVDQLLSGHRTLDDLPTT